LVSIEAQKNEPVPAPKGWRYWCAYAVMIAPNAAVGLTLAAMPPILPELALHLGGQRSAQLITSVAGFGMIVGGMFSGRLLEWVGIRAFTLASLLLYGAFGMLGLFLDTPISMGSSRFALGVAGVFFSTAALALTAATFSGEARSRVIGLQQATSQGPSCSSPVGEARFSSTARLGLRCFSPPSLGCGQGRLGRCGSSPLLRRRSVFSGASRPSVRSPR
jgi:MFS family permease